MKKILTMILLISILILTACQDTESKDSDMKIGLVIGITGIDDKSFNQSSWEGITRFAKEENLSSDNYKYTLSYTQDDFAINLSDFADKKMDLTIAPGFYFRNAVQTVAEKYPKQKFLIVDTTIDKQLDNVKSITFATNEGSFLAGIIAANKAKEIDSNTIGFIGGVDIPEIQNFEAGFIQGIKEIDPNLNIKVKYANDFDSPIKGKKIASTMYDDGVKIIFNVAGSTGNGIIEEAVNRNKNGEEVWVIGVDKDQYNDGIYAENKSCILTSMMKRLDNAIYDTLKELKSDSFSGKHIVYSLKNEGISLPKVNPNVNEEWIQIINDYKSKIISGEIEISDVPDRLL